jgi:hypothetical protein
MSAGSTWVGVEVEGAQRLLPGRPADLALPRVNQPVERGTARTSPVDGSRVAAEVCESPRTAYPTRGRPPRPPAPAIRAAAGRRASLGSSATTTSPGPVRCERQRHTVVPVPGGATRTAEPAGTPA